MRCADLLANGKAERIRSVEKRRPTYIGTGSAILGETIGHVWTHHGQGFLIRSIFWTNAKKRWKDVPPHIISAIIQTNIHNAAKGTKPASLHALKELLELMYPVTTPASL